jgi:hypothetical protein
VQNSKRYSQYVRQLCRTLFKDVIMPDDDGAGTTPAAPGDGEETSPPDQPAPLTPEQKRERRRNRGDGQDSAGSDRGRRPR